MWDLKLHVTKKCSSVLNKLDPEVQPVQELEEFSFDLSERVKIVTLNLKVRF